MPSPSPLITVPLESVHASLIAAEVRVRLCVEGQKSGTHSGTHRPGNTGTHEGRRGENFNGIIGRDDRI
jgi:hypothetical protein